MRGWSLPLGRYFGVDLRLHMLFVLLFPAVVLFSSSFGRGLSLWLLMLAAVLVRETGRGLASAAAAQPVTQLILLPTGAVPAETRESQTARSERLVALAGPMANFFVGITMALLMYTATSKVNLFLRPWIASDHLLRSAIWAQVLLGGLNLLPAYPLDAGVVLRRQLRRVRGATEGSRATAGLSQALGAILIVAGAGVTNMWMVVMGCSILLTSRSEAVTAMAGSAAESVTVADVMLTQFTTVHASETLEEALGRSVHSLQDVFPVVRGPVVVGAITREAIQNTLLTNGNSYVQSAMTRRVETVQDTDLLLPALRRIQNSPAAQMVPVLRDDAVVGILTPGHLSHSMALLGRSRRAIAASQHEAGRDD